MVMFAEVRSAQGPSGSWLVARFRRLPAGGDLFAGLPGASIRCAGCGRELAPDGCFTLRRVAGAAGPELPLCTFCEPIPRAAVLESLHFRYRSCEHPACRHPRLVSRLRRFGPADQHAELEWVHERPLPTWGPGAPVHRPRPGPVVG